jgi:hypothetical protein
VLAAPEEGVGGLAPARQARGVSDCAGAILVAWISAEALIIPFSRPQSTFLGVGLLVIALGRRSAP